MSAIENATEPHTAPLSAPPAEPGRPVPSRNVGGLWRRAGLGLILLAAAGLGYYKYQQNQQQADETQARTTVASHRPVPVAVVTVASRSMPVYLTALGTVTAYNTVTVKSRVDGQLLSVNVREGQQVHQGQLLAVIDPKPYQAVEAQAEGQLAKDQAAADYSKAEATRYTALYDAGVVSKESQQTQLSSAGQSVGTLSADRAAIQAAKVNVAYTHILSPINGVVGLRQVDAGNIVHAADTNGLLVVTQLQPIAVIFTLPEDQLPQVMKLMHSGRSLTAEAFDRSETTRLANGTLLTIDNEIDPTTGTVKAKAVFANTDGALFPNQFVNIRLILEQRPDSIVVPAAAIQNGANGPFVYLLKSGTPPRSAEEDDSAKGPKSPDELKAQREAEAADASKPKYFVEVRNIAVDLTEGSQAILRGGLAAGDRIVIDGQEKLKQFSRVDPRDSAPHASPEASIAPPATAAAHPGVSSGRSTQ